MRLIGFGALVGSYKLARDSQNPLIKESTISCNRNLTKIIFLNLGVLESLGSLFALSGFGILCGSSQAAGACRRGLGFRARVQEVKFRLKAFEASELLTRKAWRRKAEPIKLRVRE